MLRSALRATARIARPAAPVRCARAATAVAATAASSSASASVRSAHRSRTTRACPTINANGQTTARDNNTGEEGRRRRREARREGGGRRALRRSRGGDHEARFDTRNAASDPPLSPTLVSPCVCALLVARLFSTSRVVASDSDSAADAAADDPLQSPRESMEYDVLIVGAGPAGLSAAIRLKQQAALKGRELSVCVVEKGAEVGSHILSGNVLDPRALDELLPEWREMEDCPVKVPVKKDKLLFLTKSSSFPLPVPPSLHNDGNYIISLSQLARWLATKAEALGVEIYPGFAASEVLYTEGDSGAVRGIATKDVGIGKDGKPRDNFARGMELHAKQTLFAEGTRGSLSETIMAKYSLRKGVDPQTYGLGIKVSTAAKRLTDRHIVPCATRLTLVLLVPVSCACPGNLGGEHSTLSASQLALSMLSVRFS